MSLNIHSSPEHEFEPELGLPEKLPQGEKVLWQGSPDMKTLLVKVFHIKGLAVYFALLLTYRIISGMLDSEALYPMLLSVLQIIIFSSLGLGLIGLLGYLMASTAVYTITNKRVVMRIGIVLNMTFNFPLKQIESADCGLTKDGCGDIYLKLAKGTRIAIFHLWPHSRPGKWSVPQPTLRCVKNCAEVAQILVDAWSLQNNVISRSVQIGKMDSGESKRHFTGVETA